MKEEGDKGVFKTIFAPVFPILGEIFAATLVINVLGFAIPVFILQVYDRVIAQAGISTLQGLIIGMAGVIIFDFILRQARSSLLQNAAMRLDATLAKQLFRKFTSLPLRILEHRPSAFWQSLFHDVDNIRMALSGIAAILLADLPFSVIGIILIIALAEPLAWALLFIVPLFLLLAFLSSLSARNSTKDERTATMRRDALVSEMIADRTTIKALGMGSYLGKLWEERQAKTIDSSIKKAARADRYHNLGKTLLLSSTVTLTGFGAIAIINQEMTVGALIAANMLVSRILQPLNQLVLQWKSLSAARQSYKRVVRVLDYPEDRQDATLELERPKGKITMDAIAYHFGDEENTPVIRGVGASLGATGLHAIVGPNGSGKSTLLKLMRGLYTPRVGRIMLDNADMSQFSDAEKLNWFGYLPQDTRLLSGTIKDNLSMGPVPPSDETISKATKIAGIHDEIMAMQQGYSTQVGEHGDNLSGGLRQRLALARTLVTDPVVLLLDEPSNNLDTTAEIKLARLLKKLSEQRTVIMVTHSMKLLEICDSIMVLERGQVKAGGKASDILPRLKGVR
ncbi:ABC-type protease/lipase transporter [Candidatus Terasakiella magnetica]|uniref:ABC-type protease/lipase transporter n=1 Tax=Candidatus Terasakiella magnetica TaxID=1867952 RepID=A0A1C3RJ63_9PROT|nr:ABC transporter transmembrane domain-containing protein [Candidatus Terasakiella magnetica]SCA57311.1 ABC-type protease/lipase transporter [Candidatus Terasakiella magnetica]